MENIIPETNSKCTWKWMIGRRSFPFWGFGLFSGANCYSFREGRRKLHEWYISGSSKIRVETPSVFNKLNLRLSWLVNLPNPNVFRFKRALSSRYSRYVREVDWLAIDYFLLFGLKDWVYRKFLAGSWWKCPAFLRGIPKIFQVFILNSEGFSFA